MLQYLLYIVAPSRRAETEAALTRLKATPVANQNSLTVDYELSHRVLGSTMLSISLLFDLDGIVPHMRLHPVDLLVYDERGDDAIEALSALTQIKQDLSSLAQHWGPDFLFPMRRVVAVLRESNLGSHRIFNLGELAIRDVMINPPSTGALLGWLAEVLNHGIMREDKTGLALSGGGIEGFLYQLGVLHALNQALYGRALNEVDMVSGISSGAICGATLAAKIPTGEVIRSIHRKSKILPSFSSQTIFDIAGAHIIKGFTREMMSWRVLSPNRWLDHILRSFPTGFFKGDKLEQYFKTSIELYAPEDKISAILKPKLYIGATDQDSFNHIVFGEAPWEHIPISAAIRASSSLPPLFAPKVIDGRQFIDGQVTNSCNFEILAEKKCRLIFIIDPLKPAAAPLPGTIEKEGGLFGIVQTVKALIATRFETSLKAVSEQYPDTDFIVFQPDEECAKVMAGSPMRFRLRTKIIALAYQGTLRKLRERHNVYSVKLGRFGFALKSPQALKSLESEYEKVFQS